MVVTTLQYNGWQMFRELLETTSSCIQSRSTALILKGFNLAILCSNNNIAIDEWSNLFIAACTNSQHYFDDDEYLSATLQSDAGYVIKVNRMTFHAHLTTNSICKLLIQMKHSYYVILFNRKSYFKLQLDLFIKSTKRSRLLAFMNKSGLFG